MGKVVLVDKNDNPLGLEDKIKAHLREGILHRAFVVFVFNDKNELLIQKRSKEKMLWPLFWDGTCASHPKKNENYQKAGERRLKEELGFSCRLRLFDKFQYQSFYKNIGTENEICAILVGNYNGEIIPNIKEIADWKWINFSKLKQNIKKSSQKYAPWFIIGVERLSKTKILNIKN